MSTHIICFAEALLISTHNICFCGEIRKIFIGYPPLSRPMGALLQYILFLFFQRKYLSLHPIRTTLLESF